MPEDVRVVAGDVADARTVPEGRGTSPSPSSNPDKKQKKKVRSAWISFVSRILAQLIGAVATVVLGVVALHRYQAATLPPNATPQPAPAAQSRLATDRADGRVYIAVLPFENYSGDARHDHLADALTEGLVSELSQVASLRVVSRTSSMQYRGARRPIPEIGRELGVDLLVEGSFVRDGERLRVIAQLIDARRDEHLWAASYRRAALGPVALQDELATAIAKDVERMLTELAQWQAALPESRNVAPATGVKSQR